MQVFNIQVGNIDFNWCSWSVTHTKETTLKPGGAYVQHPSRSLHFQDPAKGECDNTLSSCQLFVLQEKDQVRKKQRKGKKNQGMKLLLTSLANQLIRSRGKVPIYWVTPKEFWGSTATNSHCLEEEDVDSENRLIGPLWFLTTEQGCVLQFMRPRYRKSIVVGRRGWVHSLAE